LDSSQLFSKNEIAYLQKQDSAAGVWTLTSPDGEGGHVGTVLCEVAFAVLPSTSSEEIGQIIVVYRAKLLDKPATTINLTHHWGFNLDASAVAKGKPTPATEIGIEGHHVQFKSKNILNLDPVTSLPTGTLLPLSQESAKGKDFGGDGKLIGKTGEGYPQPLESGDKLGQGFPGIGYDDFWVFDREKKEVAVPEAKKEELNVFAEIEKE
jgi:aldose 1-epimerase